jgi:hypothetical protein
MVKITKGFLIMILLGILTHLSNACTPSTNLIQTAEVDHSPMSMGCWLWH